eukprot:m.22805 g.22805  ORF g.22805 m.22805 type:complete len:312 (+) comp4033_c1_seq1:283-1218(+)
MVRSLRALAALSPPRFVRLMSSSGGAGGSATKPTGVTDRKRWNFARSAASYDALLRPILFDVMAEEMGMRLHALAPKRVLEIAAGTGAVTDIVVRELGSLERFVVTDIEESMLSLSRDRARTPAAPNLQLEFALADAQDLPFDENSFDAVVCQFGIMFVPDKAKAMAEMHRVLRPGGHVLLSTWDSLQQMELMRQMISFVQRVCVHADLHDLDGPFRMSNPTRLRQIVEGAHFERVGISHMTVERQIKLEQLATSLLRTVPPLAPVAAEMPDRFDALVKNTIDHLTTLHGSDSSKLALAAWFIEGTKAGKA